MTKKPKNCWYCKGHNFQSHGTWFACLDCGATTSPLSATLAPPALVLRRYPVLGKTSGSPGQTASRRRSKATTKDTHP